jgi:hypothetical protein
VGPSFWERFAGAITLGALAHATSATGPVTLGAGAGITLIESNERFVRFRLTPKREPEIGPAVYLVDQKATKEEEMNSYTERSEQLQVPRVQPGSEEQELTRQ